MIRRLIRLLPVLLAVLPVQPASAQQPAAAKSTNALFLTLALKNDVVSVFYEHKGRPVPLQASQSGLSSLYETDASREVSVFRLLPSADPARPPERREITRLTLPAGNPHLLLFTGNADPAKVTVRAIEDSWDSHPEKTFRLINDSRRTVAVRLGDQDRVLKPGDNSVLKPSGEDNDFDFKAATWEDDGWVLRIQSPQSIIPRTRATLVIYDQPATRENPNPDDLVVGSFIDAQRLTVQ